MSARHLVITIGLACGLAGCARDTRPPMDADTARIAAADTEPGNWLTHGRTYGEQRFSPLRAIDTRTVKDLGLAWSYDLQMNRGAEATPLVVDGVIYVTSAWSIVHAIDAKTGRPLRVAQIGVPEEPQLDADAFEVGDHGTRSSTRVHVLPSPSTRRLPSRRNGRRWSVPV